MTALRFADLFNQPERPPLTVLPAPITEPDAAHARRYALAALNRENAALAAAREGERNDQLNKSTFSVAQLVPHITETEIRDTLGSTAKLIGLTDTEIHATLGSGITKGRLQPRTIPAPQGGTVDILEDWGQADTHPETSQTVTDQFWASRGVLAHIRVFAHARLASPWAVLGGCMLRAVCAMPPHVVTPPIIGGVGSLNLLIGLVGPSGAGKGASEAAAADALTWPAQDTAPLGSGEGITHAYAKPSGKKPTPHDPDPDPLTWHTRSVLFSAAEIDQVSAISQRRGSTLMPQLRSAYSGERLGMQYADATRRIILPAHQYRFGLSVGVQPDRAHALLDEADGGTPQRFLWLPVTDPQIGADDIPAPDPWPWVAPLAQARLVPGVRRDRHGREVLPVPDEVRATIRGAHIARARGEGDALDGHALYTRLKVAHALAFLDRRPVIDQEDWELAGTVMAVSDLTRTRVQARLSEASRQADDVRARRDARRQAITDETVADEATKRVAKTLGKRLREAPAGLPRSHARRGLTSRDRGLFEDALQRLIDAGQVGVSETESGEVLRWSD